MSCPGSEEERSIRLGKKAVDRGRERIRKCARRDGEERRKGEREDGKRLLDAKRGVTFDRSLLVNVSLSPSASLTTFRETASSHTHGWFGMA